MSAPTTVRVCACGHPERLHSDEYGCDKTACGCTTFRPGSTSTAAPRIVPPAASSPSGATRIPPAPPVAKAAAEQILAAARRSPKKTTVQLAEKITGLLLDLERRVIGERVAAEEHRRREQAREAARAEVARLERALAEARARARGEKPVPHTATSPTAGPHTCTECPRTFTTEQGLAVHLGRAHHIGRDAKAG